MQKACLLITVYCKLHCDYRKVTECKVTENSLSYTFTNQTAQEKNTSIKILNIVYLARMWADAQRDGCPAECTQCALLNAVDQITKIMKPRRETAEICWGAPNLSTDLSP